jgi:uncharacterized membrane protein (UPF0127 family)
VTLVRRARWLLVVAAVLVGLGLYAFVVRGASQPADPVLESQGSATTRPELVPPGDPARVPIPEFSELAVTVQPPGKGTLVAWCLLAALNAEQRSKGLMGVTDLHGYSGMVFVYAEDVRNDFYMKDTPTALSIAWIGSDGAVVSTADMAPCGNRNDCRLYSAAGPYRMAIEVPEGGLGPLGIVPGATVTLSGACAPRTTS